MHAWTVFGRRRRKVVQATFCLDRNHAFEVHSIEWVAGFRPNHPDVHPSEVNHEYNRGKYDRKNYQSYDSAEKLPR
jgi:hypothetical protein